MKSLSITSFRFFISACIFLISHGNNSYASHIVGADFYYTHISDSTYKITIALHGDCGPASASAFSLLPSCTPNICIFDGATFDTSLNLAIELPTAGVEITNACSGILVTQCTTPTSIIPGIKKFVYSTVYTLPHNSPTWLFKFFGFLGSSSAGRAGAITNINSAGTSAMTLTATLNSLFNNSNPNLSVSQQSYFCFGIPQTYSPVAVDPDGDVLTMHLTPAMTNSGGSCGDSVSAVTYNAPFTAIAPLSSVSGSFVFDTTNGDMAFTANALQRSVIVYTIEERRSGIPVGTSQREMTVLTITCSGICDTSTGISEMNTENVVSIYPNPAMDELNISMESPEYHTLSITSAVGKVILSNPLTATLTTINISRLPGGVYYITLNGEGKSSVQKIVIMR